MTQMGVSTYVALRDKVREVLLQGQRKIEEAKVLTYWNTGQSIQQHILQNKERAEYGRRIIERLAEDLEVDESVLRRCFEFAKKFSQSKIHAARHELTWAHYRALIAVPDEKKRLALADKAAKEKWSSRELGIEIRNLLWDKRVEISDGKPSLLPVPVLGPFYTYQITKLDEFSKTRQIVVGAKATTAQPESIHPEVPSRVLDLGFSSKKDMVLFPACKLQAGSIVTSVKDGKGNYSLRLQTTDHRLQQTNTQHSSLNAQDSLLYTYKAFVTKVIDGDTLKVEIDIGFGDWHGETIRLKGIDCPEIDTPEGQSAKRFVERQLRNCEHIIVKSIQTRKEKWGRYLGDVILPARDRRPPRAALLRGKQTSDCGEKGDLVYLNNLLLEKGHAVRVRN